MLVAKKGPSVDVQVCGVLGDSSPMKKGRDAVYFEGEIMDGNKRVRLYGFDSSVRKRLLEETGKGIILGNCKVKRSRYGNDYEVNRQYRIAGLYREELIFASSMHSQNLDLL